LKKRGQEVGSRIAKGIDALLDSDSEAEEEEEEEEEEEGGENEDGSGHQNKGDANRGENKRESSSGSKIRAIRASEKKSEVCVLS